MAGTSKVYVAAWAIHGLGDKILAPGDRVVAESDSEQVEQLVARGALVIAEDQSDANADLSSLSKAELVEHARERYGAELDKSETKADLLAAIEELEQKAAVAAAAAEEARIKAETEQNAE